MPQTPHMHPHHQQSSQQSSLSPGSYHSQHSQQHQQYLQQQGQHSQQYQQYLQQHSQQQSQQGQLSPEFLGMQKDNLSRALFVSAATGDLASMVSLLQVNAVFVCLFVCLSRDSTYPVTTDLSQLIEPIQTISGHA